MKLTRKDLMIDDLVLFDNKALKKKYPVKLKDFMRIQLGTLDEAFEPILLTEEILEKNKFKKDASNNFYISLEEYEIHVNFENTCNKLSTFCVSEKKNTGRSVVFSSYGIDTHKLYVHELQHALRLCGLAELADNFIA